VFNIKNLYLFLVVAFSAPAIANFECTGPISGVTLNKNGNVMLERVNT
jgi:hypothetical protein